MSQLKKAMTLPGLTLLAIGACLGSGIFLTPSTIASDVGMSDGVFLVWLVGGLVTLAGALTYAELGSMFPEAGGVYVYIREAMGRLGAFLYGWVFLTVINTGALAALSIAFVDFFVVFIPLSETGRIGLAVLILLLLCLLNIMGIDVSRWIIRGLTSVKIALILGLVLLAAVVAPTEQNALSSPGSLDALSGSGFFVALVGAFWSFGGWYHVTFLAGEAKRPQHTVPRALVLATLTVTLTYLMANWAYMKLLPMPEMMASKAVAADALLKVTPAGAKIMSAIVMISIFGTISIYTMSAPRVYFAMARDGIFFSSIARVHPRYRTPYVAIALQCLMAILLLLFWKTFANLITYVIFIDMVFLVLGALCIFIFRRSRPDAPRPFYLRAYWMISGFFVVMGLTFIFMTLIERPVQAWAGLIVLSVGVLVYMVFFKPKRIA